MPDQLIYDFQQYWLVLITAEAIATILFYFLDHWMRKPGNWKPSGIAIFKGILERLVLLVGLRMNYPQILIVFGAMKIGTRLSEDK